MVGQRKLSNLEGSEGEEFNSSDLFWGDDDPTETEEPSAEEVQASADDLDDGPDEGEEGEEGTDPDEGEEDEDLGIDEYSDGEEEEDDADGEESPPAQAPAAQAPAPDPAAQQQSSSDSQAPQQPRVLHEVLKEHFEPTVEHLANSVFKLPKEDAELFDEGLPEFIAKNNARVYTQTMISVSELMHKALPAIVGNLSNVNHESRQHEQSFFSRHEDLAKIDKQELARVGAFVKNSKAQWSSREEFMDEVAKTVRFFKGIPQPQAKQKAANGKGNGKTRTTKTVSRMPFVPAGRTAGGGAGRQGSAATKKRVAPLQSLNDMLMTDFED